MMLKENKARNLILDSESEILSWACSLSRTISEWLSSSNSKAGKPSGIESTVGHVVVVGASLFCKGHFRPLIGSSLPPGEGSGWVNAQLT